ncbi:cardiolipin synthase [Thiogranum longum]|uniref:Cardiolipin synthase n=1 Tax=Thiogranum longum TaxID=1537524 RepID=A0A4V2PGV9_9GAMM|nr:phospholipase D-like domain-containing protein [Thiogranum longum]TCK18326.1 cardiolipin synthase [Thiogranum longum]
MSDERPPDHGSTEKGFVLFTEGDLLYEDMLTQIAAARTEVLLESYIFADDEIGQRFAQLLSNQAQAGVRVRIHLDAAGSFFWSSHKLTDGMISHGVQVRWFHRWDWRRPWRYNQRNHRKLLVVDGNTAWVGGFNIHRENSISVYGPARWRDMHVRFGGNLAAQARILFDDFWRGKKRSHFPLTSVNNTLLVSNYTRGSRRYMNMLFRQTMADAQQSIHVTTPYFIPDSLTQKLLTRAARQGIKVKLLVPGKTDIPLTRWAAQAVYAPLLDAGVQIHEYLPRLLHAKAIVVDRHFTIIGTSNIDYRSFFLNYELNLFTQDEELCHQLETQFIEDLDSSREISAVHWKRRFWGDRLLELIGWMARRWL